MKLDTLRIPLRPTDAELAPLPFPRDTLPEGRVTHRLILTYKLSMAEAGKVTPTLPMLNGWAPREGWCVLGWDGCQSLGTLKRVGCQLCGVHASGLATLVRFS